MKLTSLGLLEKIKQPNSDTYFDTCPCELNASIISFGERIIGFELLICFSSTTQTGLGMFFCNDIERNGRAISIII